MTREGIRACIVEIGIIPALRVYSESEALFAAEAVCSSGIPIVEVTMTIPGAVRIIGELTRHRTGIIVGAGLRAGEYLDEVGSCLPGRHDFAGRH